jgi:hypothetical protein
MVQHAEKKLPQNNHTRFDLHLDRPDIVLHSQMGSTVFLWGEGYWQDSADNLKLPKIELEKLHNSGNHRHIFFGRHYHSTLVVDDQTPCFCHGRR